MAERSSSVDTLLTADLNPRGDKQGKEFVYIDAIKKENDRLLAENHLLKRQLYLVRENTGLRVSSVVSQILSWFDEGANDSILQSYLQNVTLHEVDNADKSGFLNQTNLGPRRSRSLSPAFTKAKSSIKKNAPTPPIQTQPLPPPPVQQPVTQPVIQVQQPSVTDQQQKPYVWEHPPSLATTRKPPTGRVSYSPSAYNERGKPTGNRNAFPTTRQKLSDSDDDFAPPPTRGRTRGFSITKENFMGGGKPGGFQSMLKKQRTPTTNVPSPESRRARSFSPPKGRTRGYSITRENFNAPGTSPEDIAKHLASLRKQVEGSNYETPGSRPAPGGLSRQLFPQSPGVIQEDYHGEMSPPDVTPPPQPPAMYESRGQSQARMAPLATSTPKPVSVYQMQSNYQQPKQSASQSDESSYMELPAVTVDKGQAHQMMVQAQEKAQAQAQALAQAQLQTQGYVDTDQIQAMVAQAQSVARAKAGGGSRQNFLGPMTSTPKETMQNASNYLLGKMAKSNASLRSQPGQAGPPGRNIQRVPNTAKSTVQGRLQPSQYQVGNRAKSYAPSRGRSSPAPSEQSEMNEVVISSQIYDAQQSSLNVNSHMKGQHSRYNAGPPSRGPMRAHEAYNNNNGTSIPHNTQKYADQLDSVAMSRQDSDMSSSVMDGNSGNYSKLKYSGEEHVANITRGSLKNSKRIIGEIAFQLDRRILNYVFAGTMSGNSHHDRRRFYGYIIQNIPEKIVHESIDKNTGQIDQHKQMKLTKRYDYIMNFLKPHGYDMHRHSELCTDLVNKYGLLPLPPNRAAGEGIGADLKEVVMEIVEKVTPDQELRDARILLECLACLSEEDGRPMIMF